MKNNNLFLFEQRDQLLKKHKSKYRRVIAFSLIDLNDAYNNFDEILENLLEHAVKIRKKYPDKFFPFLFVFHEMDEQLCKPIYADFFRLTEWIVTSNGDMPAFITMNAI